MSDKKFGFTAAGIEQVSFSFLMADTLKLISNAVDTEMKEIGLTRSQWATLVQVFRLESPTQVQLANIVGIGRAAMGVILDQLEKSGHITREADINDRRIWRIIPTELALKQSREIARVTERATQKIFSGIESTALQNASTLFVKIKNNLS